MHRWSYQQPHIRFTIQLILAVAILLLLIAPSIAYGQNGQTPNPSIPTNGPYVGTQVSATGDAKGFMAQVYLFLWDFVVGVFQFFATLGQRALNVSLEHFVFGFGSYFNTTGLGSAINSLWSVVRDLFNLAFIFGLVYIGFQLILNNDTRAKKTLATLIIAALLINFSLFATKFIVDVTNITAVQLASFISTGSLATDPSGARDIGGIFQGITGITSIYEAGRGVVEQAAKNSSGAAVMGYIFGTMVFLIITSIVFFAGAFLLMVRFIALNLYMIFSPVMFLGMIFPNMSGYSSNYWRGFLGRALVAPVYVFMIYASFLIISQLNNYMLTTGAYTVVFAEGSEMVGGAGEFEADAGSAIVFFLVASGFMIASVVLAAKIGDQGASGSMRIMSSISGRAQNAIKGTLLAAPRYAGRTAAGYTARGGEIVNNNLQSTRTGRNLKRAASVVSLGSFTERQRQQVIEKGKKAKFGGSYSWQDDRDFANKEQARTNQLEAERKLSKELEEAEATMESAAATATEVADAFAELGKIMGKMTTDKKIQLGFKKLTEAHIAANITDKDIEAFEKSGKFSNNQIAQIKDARKKALVNTATVGSPVTVAGTGAGAGARAVPKNTALAASPVDQNKIRQNMVRNLNTQDAGKLPVDVFKQIEMYDYLTPAMVESRMRNGQVTDGDVDDMRAALEAHLGIGAKTLPSTVPGLANNQWTKWERSNSTYAAQFFN